MAYAAQTGAIPADAWILFVATLCWAVAYDTAYAMVDRDDDFKIGVQSTAILFGRADRALIALFHLLTLGLLAWAGTRAGLEVTYYMGLAGAALLALYQQWLMRARQRDGCFRAFLNNNWFGAVIFAGLMLSYL
jgi:4-hydroxybenzoate polyprenyltransferase